MRRFAALAVTAAFPFFLGAAQLTLRDGSVVEGKFISGNPTTITFEDDQGMRRQFDVVNVKILDFRGSGDDSSNNQRFGSENRTVRETEREYVRAAGTTVIPATPKS